MAMNLRPMRWEVTVSDGQSVCHGDDCEGAVIPAGASVHTRYGNQSECPEAYPNDPTTFCEPCVTPADMRALEAAVPSKQALRCARHALGVISPNDLMFWDELALRRVANVIDREMAAK